MKIARGGHQSENGLSLDMGRHRQVFADVHCHCLPNLDDGPGSLAQALALCRQLVADGVAEAVATPHQLGRFEGRYDAKTIRQAVERLNQNLGELRVPLAVLPGADVRLDERLPQLLESDEVLTVADAQRHILLELPHEVFIDPSALLARLSRMGLTAVITHPERHGFLARNPGYVERWAQYSPCLQITAGSLVGDFGRQSEKAAWAFVLAPLPVLVATDAHNTTSRAARMTEAYRCLVDRLSWSVAQMLCVENPRRLVAGRSPVMLNEALPEEATR